MRCRTVRSGPIAVGVATALLALVPRTAGAVGGPSPGAVSPQTVKLPAAPGSIRGLTENASVSSYTGQVQYSVPIELPSGVAGFAPSLVLGYDGGLGNGPLGVGWGFAHAGIRRTLRLGVPTYTDADELELVGIAGGGQLVAIGNGQYRAEGQGNSYTARAIDGGFELIDPNGQVFRFGTTTAGRKAAGTQTAFWYLEQIRNVAGQVIDYHYAADRGEVYLASITWGPSVTGAPAYRCELVYQARGDTSVSYRTGFKVESALRLAQIKIWSFGSLRRSVELAYEESFALSRLHEVEVRSSDGTATLPPLSFEYSQQQSSTVVQVPDINGWALNLQGTSMFDVDGDGAMDLLRLTTSGHSYRRNLGGHFDTARTIAGAAGAALDQVRLLDLTGDSTAELVWQQGSQWSVFQLTAADAVNRSWTALGTWTGAQNVPLTSLAVADLNGDYRMDTLQVSGSSIQVRMGGASGLAPPVLRGAIDPARSYIAPGNSATSFPDINGDGLADVVYLSASSMFLYLGKGDGTFEKYVDLAYPWQGTVATSQIRLGDLNRDGLMDVAVVRAGDVAWYRGLTNGGFDSTPYQLTRPAGTDASVVVVLADANGNGSEDLVWSSPTGMWILDFAGSTSAGMLTDIRNGLGQTQHFEYLASTQLALAASDAGAPWATTMPVSIPVSTRMLLDFASGQPTRSSRLAVRDGVYDRSERRFLGFRESTLTRPDPTDGAPASQTIRLTQRYAEGLGADRALRGQVIYDRLEDGAGVLFRETTNDATTMAIAELGSTDPRLRKKIIQASTSLRYEGQPTAISTRVEYRYDTEGRVIEELRRGRTDQLGDEAIMRYRYTEGRSSRGVRDKLCESITLGIASNGAETELARTQTLYGSDVELGALCDASAGWERSVRGYLASENRWIEQKATAYDARGNRVQTTEKKITSNIEYDAWGLHPIAETVVPHAGQSLRWESTWDNIQDVPLVIREPSGVVTNLGYDGLGRNTSLGQGTASAHGVHRYHTDSPHPYIEHFEYDAELATLGALPSTWTPASHWRHRVEVFDSAGQPLFDATRLDLARWLIGNYRVRDALGRTTSISETFEWQGDIAALPAATPPTGTAVRTTTYDALDRPVVQTLPTGSSHTYEYRAFQTISTTDGLSPVTSYLDGLDRIRRTERAVATTTESVDATYDAAGRITSMHVGGATGAPSALHQFNYDTLGRLTFASDPDIGERHMTYDDGDRLLSNTNGAGQTTSYTYDDAGRLTTTLGSDGAQYTYHYDTAAASGFANTMSRLASVDEPTGVVQLGYDSFGRLERLRRTVQGSTFEKHVAFGASGLALRTSYDDGFELANEYDAAGRAIRVGNVWLANTLDSAGRVTRESFGNNIAQSYVRNALGQALQVKVTRGATSIYNADVTYNDFDAIATVVDNDGVGLDHSASYDYDAAGRIKQAVMGNVAAPYTFKYQYDALQNMTWREVHGPSALGVLTGTYTYGQTTSGGAHGPRQLTTITPSVAAGSPANATPTAFEYDAAGRMIQQGARTLTYNGFDQLIRVAGVPGGDGIAEYAYGYDGQRVLSRAPSGANQIWFDATTSQSASGTRDYYVRLADRLLARVTRNTASSLEAGMPAQVGAVISFTLLGGALVLVLFVAAVPGQRRRPRVLAGLALATFVTASCSTPGTVARSALSSTTQVLYYHTTTGPGAALTTRDDGSLFEERRTEPFGVAIDAYRDLVGGGSQIAAVDYQRDPNNSLNKVTDPATGWSDHGARWLAPETSRWLTPDPPVKAPDGKFMMRPWELHPYQYVNQNPMLYWDPDGKEPRPQTSGPPPELGAGVDWSKKTQAEALKTLGAIPGVTEPPTGPINQGLILRALDWTADGPGDKGFGLRHPIDVWTVDSIGDSSLRAAQVFARGENFRGPLHNNRYDAYRHAFLSFKLSQTLGTTEAKEALDGHERTDNNPSGELIMDLWNNAVGRRLAENPANWYKGPEGASAVAKQALDNGLLMTEPYDHRLPSGSN